jgi:hypothetical protein
MKFSKQKSALSVLMVLVSLNLFATKYAGEIFRMGAGVRNIALGNIGVSDQNSAALAYWNPSLLHLRTETDFELMHAEEYAGLLKYDTFSAVFGSQSNFSVVLTRIGIDNIPLTKLSDPENPVSNSNRPYKYKSVNNSDIAGFLGIYHKIGKHHLGITPKFAYRVLAEETGFGFGADISTHLSYAKGIVGIRLRDFFTTQILWSTGTHEVVLPGLDIEGNYSFIMPGLNKESTFYLGTEINSESMGKAASVSLDPFSLDFHAGLEVSLHQVAQMQVGYDMNNITAGLMLHIRSWQISYAFENNPELENSHRLAIGYRL